MVAFVSAVKGVEARTQTSPDASLIAVVRPPILNIPSRVNVLVEANCHNDSLARSGENTRRKGQDIVEHLGAKDSIRKVGDMKNNNADFTYYYVDHGNGEFATMWIWWELSEELSERERDDVSWLSASTIVKLTSTVVMKFTKPSWVIHNGL